MSNLFGTSGVRGIANEDITPELAMALSKALATELGDSGEILIGRDTRLSGKMLEDSLTAGFLSAGWKVKKVGVVPTPVVGLSVLNLKADAGAMITASHNPPEYNGIKFFDSRGMALSQKIEGKIESIYKSKNFRISTWNRIKGVGSSAGVKKYLDKISSELSLKKSYKVAVDCANGPSSKTTPQLLEELGCEVKTINSQLDGTFPGRSPEPSAENLKDLCSFVKATDADIGFAHDGDGDRIAAVDENGQVVNEDKLLALIASYSIERFGGGIVTTVDASKIIEEQVSKVGGKVSRTKVGDVSVAQEMEAQDFVFGGEPSGTWIIGDIHMCPDGTAAAGRILEMLDNTGGKLSEMMESLPSYPILRRKIDCPNEEKKERMQVVEENASEVFGEIEKVLTVDGVRLGFEGGDWALIRPSGTEPYIRITAEASEKERAEDLIKKGRELLSW